MTSVNPRSCLFTSIIVSGLLALLLGGCTGPNSTERVIGSTTNSFRASVQGSATVDDGVVQYRTQGAINIEIDSIGGNIKVVGNPDATVTTVEVVREASHGYLRGSEPYEALALTDWSSEITPGPGPLETLRVRTAYDGPEAWYLQTHIRIETPDLSGVTVRTPRGSVEIINNSGRVDVQTEEGGILVATTHPQLEDNVLIGNEGDIDYRIPAGSTGDFDIAVIDGDIKTRITAGQWRYLNRGNSPDVVNATLNSGSNPVVIRTTEGDIRIAVVKNPHGYGPIRSGV
ncbi:MAG: DUF4097 family beta strand repeat-containing protein [Phycisphaerales bacterium]|jgi:hypothetical protein|nr:DUF4097 family beta strand repeat-containing protein [Phycisphaerales bacterium]